MDGIEAIRFVAERLGPLRGRMVFIGGTTVGLLVTELGQDELRITKDVDVIVEAATYTEHLGLRKELLQQGFRELVYEGTTASWVVDEVRVDIMTTAPGVAWGQPNRWFPQTWAESVEFQLQNGPTIRLVSPACFLATKLDALGDGRRGDFRSSQDLEDIVTVVNGRSTIVDDVASASREIKAFLVQQFSKLLAESDFRDALPGQLRPDALSQQRVSVVLRRMTDVAAIRP